MTPSADDSSFDDESSTEREMNKMWDKLDQMEAQRLELEKQKQREGKSIEWPASSDDDSSSIEEENPSTSVRKKELLEENMRRESFSDTSSSRQDTQTSKKSSYFPQRRRSKTSETLSNIIESDGDNRGEKKGTSDTVRRPTKMARMELGDERQHSHTTDQNSQRSGQWSSKRSSINENGSDHRFDESVSTSRQLESNWKPQQGHRGRELPIQRSSNGESAGNVQEVHREAEILQENPLSSSQKEESAKLHREDKLQQENPLKSSRTEESAKQNGISHTSFELTIDKMGFENKAGRKLKEAEPKRNVTDNCDGEKAAAIDDGSICSSSSTDSSSSDSSSSSSTTSSGDSSTRSSIDTLVDQDGQKSGEKVAERGSPAQLSKSHFNFSHLDRVENPYSQSTGNNKPVNHTTSAGPHTNITQPSASTKKQLLGQNRSRIDIEAGKTQSSEMEMNRDAHTSPVFSNNTTESTCEQSPWPDLLKKLPAREAIFPATSQSQQSQEEEEEEEEEERVPDTIQTNPCPTGMSLSNFDDPLKRPATNVQIPDYHEQASIGTEIDSSLYVPQSVQHRLPPVLHSFNKDNFPNSSRRRIPVCDLFQLPMTNLWTTKFDRFNVIQSAVSNVACHSDDHLVVAAPTGAGKTVIFEMAMARFFAIDLSSQLVHRNDHKNVSKKRKILYIAPSKALCEERYEDWCNRLSFTAVGIQVAMVTGDADPGRCYQDLEDAHVILSTPEKWDSITRRWTEKFYLLASVKLFMIDEVHLLGDDSRGSCLESIIARMKSIQRAAQAVRVSQNEINSSSYKDTDPESIGSRTRVIAVSATLPNITDVAEFIGANEAYEFDESFRPVPLAKHVVGLGWLGKNEFRFWSQLDRHVPELIQKFSRGKQALIFCHTKKETETLVGVLLKAGIGTRSNIHGNSAPGTIQHCLQYGIAYHHAGMELSDRKTIEQAFLNRQLRCLCATSTLAVGVNLPAHLVIVKGTRTWRGGGNGYQDIDRSSLLQMIGRAGRPGLDTSGTAVIMTDNKSKQSIQRLMQGLGPAESYLLPRLTDVMNVEISQRVISDVFSTVNWLKTTFFYVRLKESPEKYGCKPHESLDSHLRSICQDTISRLRDTGLVVSGGDGIIAPLEPSHIMSQNMISFGAMKQITELSSDISQARLLKDLSRMTELHLPVRRLEKKILNECHKTDIIRYKLDGPLSKVRIQSPSEKAFVLLQAYIGQFEFQNYTLSQEMTNLADTAQRLLLAAQEYSIKGSKNGRVALLCLKLRRSLHFCLWGESSGVLNQITDPKVGQQCTRNLKFGGITSFEHVNSSTEDAIEKAAGRSKPFGKMLKSAVSMIQKEKMKISAEVEYTRSNLAAGVTCNVEPVGSAVAALTGEDQIKVTFSMLAFTDRPGTTVFFEDSINGASSYKVSCPKQFGELYVHLLGSMVGIDETLVLKGNGPCLGSSLAAEQQKSKPHRRIRNAAGSIVGNIDSGRGEVQKPRRLGNTTESMAGKNNSTLERSGSHRTATVSAPQQQKQHRQKASKRSDKCRPNQKENTQDNRRGEDGPVPYVTPHMTVATHDNTKTGNAQFQARSCMAKRIQDHERRPDSQQAFASRMPGSVREKERHSAVTGPQKNSPVPSIGQEKMPFVTPPYQSRPNPTVSLRQASMQSPSAVSASRNLQSHHASNKAKTGKSEWQQAKRKQERSQKRAFPSRRDNPFASFGHDPNDAEAFLEGLSTQGLSASSIIPDKELKKLTRETSSGFPRFNRAAMPISGRKHTPNPKRRRFTRHIAPLQDASNKDLLHIKAAEHNLFPGVSTAATFPRGTNSASNMTTPVPQQFQTPMQQQFQTNQPSQSPVGLYVNRLHGNERNLEDGCSAYHGGQFQESYTYQPAPIFASDSHFQDESQDSMWEYHGTGGVQGQTLPPYALTQGISASMYNTGAPMGEFSDANFAFDGNQNCDQPNCIPLNQGGHAKDTEFEEVFY